MTITGIRPPNLTSGRIDRAVLSSYVRALP